MMDSALFLKKKLNTHKMIVAIENVSNIHANAERTSGAVNGEV